MKMNIRIDFEEAFSAQAEMLENSLMELALAFDHSFVIRQGEGEEEALRLCLHGQRPLADLAAPNITLVFPGYAQPDEHKKRPLEAVLAFGETGSMTPDALMQDLLLRPQALGQVTLSETDARYALPVIEALYARCSVWYYAVRGERAGYGCALDRHLLNLPYGMYMMVAQALEDRDLYQEGACLRAAADNVFMAGLRPVRAGEDETLLPYADIAARIDEQIALVGELMRNGLTAEAMQGTAGEGIQA